MTVSRPALFAVHGDIMTEESIVEALTPWRTRPRLAALLAPAARGSAKKTTAPLSARMSSRRSSP